MIDWKSSMQQTFEYYEVDPTTWKDRKRITNVKTSTINRDSDVETKGSTIIDITESVGECYIRTYMIAIQNGVSYKIPLGTHLVQTPSSSYDGKTRNVSMDGYTPLLELKERQPPIGYFVAKGENVMDVAYRLTRENTRAPVVKPISPTELSYDFVTNSGDNWLVFLSDLISAAYKAVYYEVKLIGEDYVKNTNIKIDNVSGEKKDELLDDAGKQIKTKTGEQVFIKTLDNGGKTYYCSVGESASNYEYDIDEMGRVLFSPKQDIASLQPVWTYNDDNSSILYPEISMNHDLYGIPNVVEVLYSNGNTYHHVRVENNDDNSPVSIKNRGREIVHRVINPDLVGNPSDSQIREYAEQLLSDLSSPEYTITYKHGYCPVRPGDCVRLNYARAGLKNVKAKVISQSIKCEPGCPVTETAVFTTKLWR